MSIGVVSLAFCSAALFGLALVLTQIGLWELSPLRGACISVPTTAAMFLAAAPFALDLTTFDATSALMFLLCGLAFPAAVTLLTFEANRRIGPHLTGSLGNLTPLFAIAVAFFVLNEAPSVGQLIGIAIILMGVGLLIGAPSASPAGAIGWGLALPFAGALIRGVVQPVVKLGLETWQSPFAAALIGYLASAAVILSVGAIYEGRALVSFAGHRWKLFLAVGACNGLAVLAMYAALARGSVTVVAPLLACYPLATLAFSWLLLGKAGITWLASIGGGLAAAGVVVLLRA
jgi:drug/metabolite transporter (DMT)-like permease